MVAPVDSKVELTVEGETFVLRLNFRTLALLEQAGLDPFGPDGLTFTLSKMAMMCMALSIDDHPSLSDQEALAIVYRSGTDFADKVRELFARFGGVADDESAEGNVRAAANGTRKPRSTASTKCGSKPGKIPARSGSKPRARSS